MDSQTDQAYKYIVLSILAIAGLVSLSFLVHPGFGCVFLAAVCVVGLILASIILYWNVFIVQNIDIDELGSKRRRR